jgi:polar amino acid transport system substrate-binding protein
VPTVDVVTFETMQQAFLALQQGKGVGYVNDEASILQDFAKLGEKNKGEPALKRVVDDTLRELETSGAAEKTFLKWFGPDTKLKFDKRELKIESDKIEG